MARKKNCVDEQDLQKLLNLTCQAFGKKLTHSFECEQLSTEIKKVTGTEVSAHTLRRLFGFLPSAFSPAVSTLNAVAAYTGFMSWHSFTQQSAADVYQPLTLDQEADLYLSFYNLDIQDEADMNYHNAARNMAFRILFNPALLTKLAPVLARNKVAQVYFFERFPFIDGLCTDYRRSLRLYLQKKTVEAQIFGNSLLFLSAYLGKREDEMKHYLKQVSKLPLHEGIHPFLIGRYLGTHILYEQHQQNYPSHWLEEARKWNQFFLKKKSTGIWVYPYFQHIMSAYLNLAKLYDESWSIMKSSKLLSQQQKIEKGYKESFEVDWQIAHHRQSPEEYKKWMATTRVFESIHPLFEKFYRLQTLQVLQSLPQSASAGQKIANQINELVRKTGFVSFLEEK